MSVLRSLVSARIVSAATKVAVYRSSVFGNGSHNRQCSGSGSSDGHGTGYDIDSTSVGHTLKVPNTVKPPTSPWWLFFFNRPEGELLKGRWLI